MVHIERALSRLVALSVLALAALWRRTRIVYTIMLPILVTGALLWFSLPYLAYVGIDFDPLELKKLGKQGVIVIAGMWLILALSTWMRARQNIDVVKWFQNVNQRSPVAGALYVTGTFLALCWFVGTILSS